jgi:cell division protease FtsH
MISQKNDKVEVQPKTSGSKKATDPNQMGKKFEMKMDFNLKRMVVWFVILLLFVPFFMQLMGGNFESQENIPISQMMQDIRDGKVEKLVVTDTELKAQYLGVDEEKIADKSESESVVDILTFAGIEPSAVVVEFDNKASSQFWLDVIVNVLPLALMVLFIVFILRQARGAQDGIMGFGKSKAKLFSKGKQDVTFKDVGGVPEAKKELEEIVDFLKHPKKFQKLGARTPKGALLVGPSGTGKTLLARAVAGEAGVTFFSMAGSEFMEMLVGVGASRVRDLFDTAKKNSPAIIFIDEIDAIGRTRGAGTAGGHDEREQTLNQILVEMDGFTPTDNVIVLAATNRGELLDQALTRPGRFDRRVVIGLPDLEERERILKIHAENKPFEGEVNWTRLAKRTVGFSGADLENMLNESAIAAARDNRKFITPADMEEAAMKVKLGPEKRRLQNDYERAMTAYHEGGHALIAHLSPHADPVHRVSIVSRGMALGFTLTPPEQDKYQQTKSELLEDVMVLLGGRSAEKLVFKELTGGASSDIDRATRIARAMVVDYGMSDLGPINLGPQYDTSSYGRAVMEPSKVSDELQSKVDAEMRKIIDDAMKATEKLLTKYRKQLDAVAEALLEKESLDTDEFEKVMGMKKAKPPSRAEWKREVKKVEVKPVKESKAISNKKK